MLQGDRGASITDPFAKTAAAAQDSASPTTRNLDDLPAALLERLGGESGRVGLVVQRNTEVVVEQTAPELEEQGVIVCSLERALVEHAGHLRERLGALIEPDYDGYAAIGAAQAQRKTKPQRKARAS